MLWFWFRLFEYQFQLKQIGWCWYEFWQSWLAHSKERRKNSMVFGRLNSNKKELKMLKMLRWEQSRFESREVFSAILGLQWRHQKFKLTTSTTKFLHKVNNPTLNVLCKFQFDLPINPRVRAVQCLDDPHTFILQQPCWKAASPFSHITKHKILQFCWPKTILSFIQIPSNLVMRHVLLPCRPYQNLGQIVHKLAYSYF